MKNKTIGLLDSILGNESLETPFESNNPELAELAAAEAANNAQTLEFAIEDAIEENEVRQEHEEELEELVEGMEHLLKQPSLDLVSIGLLYNRADKLNVKLSGKSTLPKDGMEGMDAKRLEAYMIVGQEGFMDTLKSGAKATKDFIVKLYQMVRDWIKSFFVKSTEPKVVAKEIEKTVDDAVKKCTETVEKTNKQLDAQTLRREMFQLEVLNEKLNLKGARVLGLHLPDLGDSARAKLAGLMTRLTRNFPTVTSLMGNDLSAESWKGFKKAFDMTFDIIKAVKADSLTKEINRKEYCERLELKYEDCFTLTIDYYEESVKKVNEVPIGTVEWVNAVYDFFDTFRCTFTIIADKTVIDDNPFKTLAEAKGFINGLSAAVELQQTAYNFIRGQSNEFFSSSEESRMNQNLSKLEKLNKPKSERGENEVVYMKVEQLTLQYVQAVNRINKTSSAILSTITGASKTLAKHLVRVDTTEFDKFMMSDEPLKL